MNNPLPREQRETIKRVAKYLICCGVDRVTAHDIARAQLEANLLAVREA